MSNKKKILVVDDSLILGRAIAYFLSQNGYEANSVASGEECLRQVEHGDIPDLVLMDIYLHPKGIDGLETTRRLHLMQDIPVVLHSAYNDRETLRSTANMTKYGYIYKSPGNEEFVLAHIEMAFKLIEREHMFRDLSAHLHAVKEEQSAFVAREIHDDLGQSLAALKINLTMLERAGDREKSAVIITDMRSILDDTVAKVRSLIHELRPPVLDTNGIIEALRWHTQDFEKNFGIPVHFDTKIQELELGPELSLAVFRIVQEALTNAARHANAHVVKVILRSNGRSFVVIIEDDGCGFEQETSTRDFSSKGSFGILSMRERAQRLGGRLQIRSADGAGTRVTVAFPLAIPLAEPNGDRP